MKKYTLAFLLILSLLLPALSQARESIKCASTTSTKNSGLLDYLFPLFTAASNIEIQVVVVGSGEALELGKEGAVDCVFTHAKELELELVEEGYFLDRHDIMYNDFIVLGPKDDPAGVKTVKKVSEGFKKIWENKSIFISRGDNSGTNMRENRIWASTGRMPSYPHKWYLSVDQGMAETIRITSEKQGYTLTDRGSWLSMEDRDQMNLAIVLEKDPTLFNQYGAMIVNPANHPDVQYRLAMNFIIWLTSAKGQDAIGSFTNSRGDTLFTPNAD